MEEPEPWWSCPETCPLRQPPGDYPSDCTDNFPEPVGDEGSQQSVAVRMYNPIKSEWQTRILALEPGNIGNELVGELHVADIVSSPSLVLHDIGKSIQYDALSYCWGTPDFERRILCNGEAYPITDNLYRALQRLRLKDVILYLWVDALCINQHDDAERSIQVTNMVAIYRKAAHVSIWLGEHEEGTRSAVEVLGQALFKAADHSMACMPTLRKIAIGISKITRRDWFSRVWVRQELWASQHANVHVGDTVITWEQFSRCSGIGKEVLARSPMEDSQQPDSNSAHETMISPGLFRATRERIRSTRYGEQCNPWLSDGIDEDVVTVLRRSAGTRCADSHDHIYGILGMTSLNTLSSSEAQQVGGRFGMTLAYHQPAAISFVNLAFHIINRDYSLNILLLDVQFGGRLDGMDLPSWVPDWRFSRTQCDRNLLVVMRNVETIPWCGFSTSMPTFLRNPRNCSTSNQLRVMGFRLGKLEYRVRTRPSRVLTYQTSEYKVYEFIGAGPDMLSIYASAYIETKELHRILSGRIVETIAFYAETLVFDPEVLHDLIAQAVCRSHLYFTEARAALFSSGQAYLHVIFYGSYGAATSSILLSGPDISYCEASTEGRLTYVPCNSGASVRQELIRAFEASAARGMRMLYPHASRLTDFALEHSERCPVLPWTLPDTMEHGDEVVYVDGLDIPIAIRRNCVSNLWHFVGPAIPADLGSDGGHRRPWLKAGQAPFLIRELHTILDYRYYQGRLEEFELG